MEQVDACTVPQDLTWRAYNLQEHPGSKRYPPWQRKDIDHLSIVKEDHGDLMLHLAPWSEQEIQALGNFLQATGATGSKPLAGPGIPDHVANLLIRVHEAQVDRFRERFGSTNGQSLSLLTAAALAHGEKYGANYRGPR